MKQRPDVEDPDHAIEAGWVQVDGAVVTNPKSQVLPDARIVVREDRGLKGEAKLAAGLDALGGFDFAGRTGLDVGASTGGFTTEMLKRGARRVYAVDVGHGQLMGGLRQDAARRQSRADERLGSDAPTRARNNRCGDH